MKRPIRSLASSRGDRLSLPLREHRQRARVTLDQIIEATKISRRFLEAIEAGDYDQLPGGLFSTSYIRQYAEATGYDANLILDDYRQKTGKEEAGRQPAAAEKVSTGFSLARFLSIG